MASLLTNESGYPVACCRMLGVKSVLRESLVRDVDHIADPKLRDMIKFSLKCSRNPQAVTEADYAILRERGLHDLGALGMP